MGQFDKWCNAPTEVAIAKNKLEVISVNSKKLSLAIRLVASTVPEQYITKERLADILKKFGKTKAAKRLEMKLPTSKSLRSGELGEILCASFIKEKTPFTTVANKLRWKDHRAMAMRGDDVLGFSLGGTRLKVLKAEAKSGVAMSGMVISEAREALSTHKGLPNPHSLAFIAEQAGSEGNFELQDAIDVAQLKNGLRPTQVTHMLFTFSGNNTERLLKKNLTAYSGTISQHYVGLHLPEHQDFIRQVFEGVKV